jgi:hypothetical protein
MSKATKVLDSGITLLSGVFLVFLILKLSGISIVATWSWWWVFAPLWIPTETVLLIALIIWVVEAFINR